MSLSGIQKAVPPLDPRQRHAGMTQSEIGLKLRSAFDWVALVLGFPFMTFMSFMVEKRLSPFEFATFPSAHESSDIP